MVKEKTLVSVKARHLESGLRLQGYEIHHGWTKVENLTPCVQRDDQEVIGYGSADRLVWGTYLHGIFDADDFRRWFIDRLRIRRGLAACGQSACGL